MRVLPAILAVIASPVLAETELAVRDGLLRVEGAPMALSVVLGGERIVLGEAVSYAGFVEKVGDLVLLEMASGGNACPAEYAWVFATRGGLRMTETFGTCSDLPEVSWDSETVTVTLPSMVAGGGDVAFVFDGKVVREVALGLRASGLPPGSDVRQWIGRHPYELASAAEWDAGLTALVGAGKLQAVRQALTVGSGMDLEGAWVAGSGFDKGTGDRAGIALALDGRLIVALHLEGGAPALWGDPAGELPPTILGVLGGN